MATADDTTPREWLVSSPIELSHALSSSISYILPWLRTLVQGVIQAIHEGVALIPSTLALLRNTSTSTSILTLLTGDEDDDVVRAARETLATRSRSTFVWGMGG